MSEPRYCEHTGSLLDESRGGPVHVVDGSPCYGSEGKILQIIPAGEWRALYTWKHEGKAERDVVPLAALALVEYCDRRREVVGISQSDVGFFGRADESGNFRHYLGPGEVDEEDQREAQEELRLALERRAAEP